MEASFATYKLSRQDKNRDRQYPPQQAPESVLPTASNTSECSSAAHLDPDYHPPKFTLRVYHARRTLPPLELLSKHATRQTNASCLLQPRM